MKKKLKIFRKIKINIMSNQIIFFTFFFLIIFLTLIFHLIAASINYGIR